MIEEGGSLAMKVVVRMLGLGSRQQCFHIDVERISYSLAEGMSGSLEVHHWAALCLLFSPKSLSHHNVGPTDAGSSLHLVEGCFDHSWEGEELPC